MAGYTAGLLLLLLPVMARGSVDIYRLHVHSHITHRFATTNISSHLANTDSTNAQQAVFTVTLPKPAFICYFAMIIDGEVYAGTVKEKEVARKQYERAKKRGQSAGHVAKARDTGKFKVSVNVAAASKVFFNLTYQELLTRRLGLYEHAITISPGQVVRDLKVDVFIAESRPLSVLKVPALRQDYLNTLDESENRDAAVERLGPGAAHVSYSPSQEEQELASAGGIHGQFVVQYDVQRDLDAGEIQVMDGYFVHYLAPAGLEAVHKDVLFVLDTSGSMYGTKIQQLREAMLVIVEDLRPLDRFAIVTFSDRVHFRLGGDGALIAATDDNKATAKQVIGYINASGGTNINDALMRGLGFLSSEKEEQEEGEEELEGEEEEEARAAMIIFLTDGEPTSGITDPSRIINNINAANQGRYSLFSLGFGNNVDFGFLQKLSLQNAGLARRIYEDADAALQLHGFYNEVSTPTLRDVSVTYVGAEADSLTPHAFPNYFAGSELVVAGRLSDRHASALESRVGGQSADGYLQLEAQAPVQRGAGSGGFTERLWAYLSIKKLLDAMLQDPEHSQDAKDRALKLALKYNFVTPLTSMVVTKPETPAETNEDTSTEDKPAEPPTRAKDMPARKQHSAAASPGRRGGGGSSFVDNDPHFIVRLRGLRHAVCFDIDGQQGDALQLIYDRRLGVAVHGEVAAAKHARPGSKRPRNYLGKLALLAANASIIISPHRITINGLAYSWKRPHDLHVGGGVRVRVIERRKVVVRLRDGLQVGILRHVTRKASDFKVDYLGLYVEDGSALGVATEGLIGEFSGAWGALTNQTLRLSRPGQSPRDVPVRLGTRRNMELDEHVACWFAKNHGRGMLSRRAKDYFLPAFRRLPR